jgi:hypothetical protein
LDIFGTYLEKNFPKMLHAVMSSINELATKFNVAEIGGMAKEIFLEEPTELPAESSNTIK